MYPMDVFLMEKREKREEKSRNQKGKKGTIVTYELIGRSAIVNCLPEISPVDKYAPGS